MNYRLLAADMDGTLLNDNLVISPRTQDAVRQWVDAGLLLVPTTGRPLCALGKISSLFEEDMPFIVYNGAMGIMHRSKEVLFTFTLTPELVPEIMELAEERGIPAGLWCQEKLYANFDCEPMRLFQKATSAPAKILDGPEELESLAIKGVTKIFWIDYSHNVVTHQREMPAHFGDKVNCHASIPELFEFVSPEASKAKALEKLRVSLNVSREEIIAIGDGYNDLSMLKYAGFSIAMGNAPQDIKEICNHVTLDNNNDGVAIWIENYLKEHLIN